MSWLEDKLFQYFQYLELKGGKFNLVVGFFWTIAIGVFDILAPDEATHSFLYILPIAFVTWFSGIVSGFVILLICTVFWSINNVYPSILISVWNIISTFVSFLLVAFLLHKTRTMWENEKNLSSTDPLTGARNLRAFSALVEHEMLRSQRESLSFSLAYLDLDDFKSINDTYGHKAGDELLKSIVATISRHLRKTDIVGRLGGDEFAIFFPATDQAAVKVVIQKVVNELHKLAAITKRTTTFSMGVLTCSEGSYGIDELISYADALMYEAKRAGKNNIRYAVYPSANRQELKLGW